MSPRKRIVLIGGGTGTSTILSGLQTKPVHITALISVADSGGSTGRLRDEFGFQPVGDLRQSLAALAGSHNQEWIRKVLLYRFEKGTGLKGHNLGNLILTALQDMAGSTADALAITEKVFRLRGEILPVTEHTVDLVIHYTDGSFVVGEDNLNSCIDGKQVESVKLHPSAPLFHKANKALIDADMIVIGPGDYFGSVMPALIVEGMKNAFSQVKGKVVFIVNLMTRHNQTHQWNVSRHLEGIELAIGKKVDYIIVNTGKIPQNILDTYAKEDEYPVVHDMEKEKRCIEGNFVVQDHMGKHGADILRRSLLRHDPDKIANILMEYL
ncbi:MAG: uridine diphosphate-N-acetylglucosamine-binding protein YvcK [Candidatus Pacebacteria bacterium]|nr:uridine diphosphate-N-acetylglucosamine-binding protein YvcK [Candidatus Paceibacterota bacterium]